MTSLIFSHRPITSRAKDQPARRRGRSGQALIMFIFFLVVLALFVGLGIDVGFAYVTKAQLSKAVDAAALDGMKSLSQGTVTASSVASATFAANYGKPGRDAITVVPSFIWGGTGGSYTSLTVSATTSINTFFIRVLPIWKTLPVAANAQSYRAPLIMTLVLDRSGSMGTSIANGGSAGGTYLPTAVTTFINNFDDGIDKVAMVSFSTTPTIDLSSGGASPQPTQPFKSAITTDVNAFNWNGSTFSQGGLTNALVLENNATYPSTETPIKVVVFFTDGWANIFQGTLSCPSPGVVNVGGQDSGTCVDFFSPITGSTLGSRSGSSACSAGGTVYCSTTTGFKSSIDGSIQPFLRANVSAEAQYRCVQVANSMRAAGIFVYAVGTGTADLTFLEKVANDPSTPGYVQTSYDGVALIADTNNPAEIESLFQIIASKILLRLTQ